LVPSREERRKGTRTAGKRARCSVDISFLLCAASPQALMAKKKSHQTSAAVLSDLGYSLGVISLRLRSVRVYASPRIEEPIPSIMITIAESTRGPGLGGARRGQKEEGDHKKRLFLFSL
jgi:hypothetical protein